MGNTGYASLKNQNISLPKPVPGVTMIAAYLSGLYLSLNGNPFLIIASQNVALTDILTQLHTLNDAIITPVDYSADILTLQTQFTTLLSAIATDTTSNQLATMNQTIIAQNQLIVDNQQSILRLVNSGGIIYDQVQNQQILIDTLSTQVQTLTTNLQSVKTQLETYISLHP